MSSPVLTARWLPRFVRRGVVQEHSRHGVYLFCRDVLPQARGACPAARGFFKFASSPISLAVDGPGLASVASHP